jgi:hypothetical protein
METKIDSSAPYSDKPVEEGVYMPHENIEEQIIDFVTGNIDSSRGHLTLLEYYRNN